MWGARGARRRRMAGSVASRHPARAPQPAPQPVPAPVHARHEEEVAEAAPPLPAAVIPCLTAMALYAAALVSGIVVVELVFSIPGLGQELVRGVVRREVHVVQAIALASALVVVVLNLLADLSVLALDPRTRSA